MFSCLHHTWQRAVVVISLLGCLSLALVACRRIENTGAGIAVRTTIMPEPLKVGAAKVEIVLTGNMNQPLTHATIGVEADMTHPGMSPLWAQAIELAPGRYQAPIAFNMAGDWVLLLHIKTQDGKLFERQVNVPGVQSN